MMRRQSQGGDLVVETSLRISAVNLEDSLDFHDTRCLYSNEFAGKIYFKSPTISALVCMGLHGDI